MGGETKGRSFEERKAAAIKRNRVEIEKRSIAALKRERAMTPEEKADRRRASAKLNVMLAMSSHSYTYQR